MKRHPSHAVFVTALCAGHLLPVCAQSILSVNYPAGLPLRPACGMSLSMGGTGVGLIGDHQVMMSNPANLGALDKTVFSSLINADFLNIHDKGQTANFLRVIPQQVTFGFWLGPAGTMAFSLDSRTDAAVKYRATYSGTQLGNTAGSLKEIELGYSSNGGITSWQAGWGCSILKRAYLGLAYERVYCVWDQSRMQTTVGPSGRVRSSDSTYVRWRGNAVRLGVMAPVKALTFGVTGEYFIPSPAEYSSAVYWGEANGAVTGPEEKKITLKLPPSLSAGLSYRPRPEWLFAFDMSTVLWDYYSSGGALPDAVVGRTLGFGVGVQYIPAPALLSPRYWETMRYRAGLRYQELPASENSEFAFTLGTGLPLKASGLLDFVAEYGWRNSAHFSQYGEEFFRFAIGVNAGRKWTKSSKDSY